MEERFSGIPHGIVELSMFEGMPVPPCLKAHSWLLGTNRGFVMLSALCFVLHHPNV